MLRLYAFARRVYGGYTSNRGALMAAAISYYGLISFVPLVLLAVSLLGMTLRSSKAGLDETLSLIQSVVPFNADAVLTSLRDIQHSYTITGLLGLIFLMWTGSQFFHALEDALNRTWGATRTRPFWKGRLIASGLMLTIGILLLGSIAVSLATEWIRRRHIPGTYKTLADVPFVWSALALVLPALFSVITFTLIYRIMPNAKVTWHESLVGGIFGGCLWELAKVGFGQYVTLFGQRGYNRLYGSLAGVVLLAFWVYFTANILVIGGEVAHAWCQWRAERAIAIKPKRPRRERVKAMGKRPRKTR